MIDRLHPLVGVYTITDRHSGRVYVGSSINVNRRFYEHRRLLEAGRHHSPKLQHAWNARGRGFFAFAVVELVADRSVLEQREQQWVDALGAAARKTGFNIAPVVGSPRGIKRSAETRARMSASAKARIRPPMTVEWKAKIAAANRVKPHYPHSAESRARISAAKKGVKLGPQSAEQRAKTSAALKGKKRTPEMNAEQSRRRKGVPLGSMSAESRARMSAAQLESWKRRKAAKEAAA